MPSICLSIPVLHFYCTWSSPSQKPSLASNSYPLIPNTTTHLQASIPRELAPSPPIALVLSRSVHPLHTVYLAAASDESQQAIPASIWKTRPWTWKTMEDDVRKNAMRRFKVTQFTMFIKQFNSYFIHIQFVSDFKTICAHLQPQHQPCSKPRHALIHPSRPVLESPSPPSPAHSSSDTVY